LLELKNLGPSIVRRLGEVGIHSEDDLRRVGPSKAYLLMQSKEQRRLPVCYYLYSLAGALEDRRWDEVSVKRKQDLIRKIGR
jgi:DNA transformation protein and related proteins